MKKVETYKKELQSEKEESKTEMMIGCCFKEVLIP